MHISAQLVCLHVFIHQQKHYLTPAFSSKTRGVVGTPIVELLRGSASVGQSTLTRFYSLHTFVLPLLTSVFMLMKATLLNVAFLND
jgi:quinol-cytochrome oxidoreductase complex cytochrome b subunit